MILLSDFAPIAERKSGCGWKSIESGNAKMASDSTWRKFVFAEIFWWNDGWIDPAVGGVGAYWFRAVGDVAWAEDVVCFEVGGRELA